MATGEQLKKIIADTLSPYADTRRTAEEHLKAAQRTQGHCLEVLKLVASNDGAGDMAIRQAAAVHFKNTIKKGWGGVHADDHDTQGIILSQTDRDTIKSHLVQLMCTVPPQIQAQLSESISLIAAVDYPNHWQNLLPELVQQFNSPDPAVVVGVLKTANSIFKRFRYVERSDELYRVILFTLEGIQQPLLALFKSLGQAVASLANDPVQLKPRFEALRLICRIFYSLNYQDLPEFFEDHIDEWMKDFSMYLQYQNPVLTDADEETEPSPIDSLQAAIIANLDLYGSKDEEPFIPYLPEFTKLVWNLLMTVTAYPKHDTLATASIRFLSSLVEKEMHKHLFQEEATLHEIVGKIVIPNLLFRESDEERFEDDPREFIVTEVEGSDSGTRRKCSQDLLRAMCRQFEGPTTAICSEHVGKMLAEFAADPNGKWVAKDAAIHLIMGIAIRRESAMGVSEVNEAVNIMELFQHHILPELQDQNHTARPVVKATSIKFVSTFRNQFSRENAIQLIPLLINHLASPVIVVHTFAAYAIERILMTKETVDGGAKRPKVGAADIQPFLEPLFNSLFAIVDNTQLNENDYVMKCVMRTLITAGDDVIPVTQIVITKLTAALGHVAKNPRNPQFNHYLFESIAVLVRTVCSKDSSATTSFEALLFDPFTTVLHMQIAEFTPYVFQVLSQLLEYRPTEAGPGQAYTNLFAPILTPALWEQAGNVPAMARLLQAYVRKAPGLVVESLNQVLGVFQRLVAFKSTEANAFDILKYVICFLPQEATEPKLTELFRILLHKLQKKPDAIKYKRLLTDFFALFVGKFGAQVFADRLNGLQPGMDIMILAQVWNPRIRSDPPLLKSEVKLQVIGLTKLLCESPSVLNSNTDVWCATLLSIVTLLTSTAYTSTPSGADDEIEVEIGYDAQYSRLVHASRMADDFFADVPDPSIAFVQSLHALSASQPGMLLPLIDRSLSQDPKLKTGLTAMFQQAGLHLG